VSERETLFLDIVEERPWSGGKGFLPERGSIPTVQASALMILFSCKTSVNHPLKIIIRENTTLK
jgi:hypothetical protein